MASPENLQLLADTGLATVFGVVLLEQLGVPIPALPVLILAGAKAYENPMFGVYALALSILACAIADLTWFLAGRRYGYRVLKLLCRVSLSPDSCVRQTESVFERRGPKTLIVARFVPGLALVAPPIAGALRLETSTFFAYDGVGAVLWSGAGLLLGVLFHDQVELLLAGLSDLGGYALLVIAILLALYVAYRFWDRWRFLRSLRTGRISVDELYTMIERGEQPIVLDVRSRSHRKLDGRRIPGALPVDLDDIERTLAAIPRDRDVVVYCACPNEASAVKVAMLLRGRGIYRVRPLAGGIDAWAAAGLAIEELEVD